MQVDKGINIKSKINFLSEIKLLMKKWISIALILFTLNAFSLNLGYGSPIFFRLCGVLSLAGTLLLYTNNYVNISKRTPAVLGMALLLASFSTILFTLSPEFWLIGLIIFVCGLDLISKSANDNDGHLIALALGSTIYTIFYIFYIHVPMIWMQIRSLSEMISGIIGRLSGVQLNIGPTMSGTLILLTFVSCAAAFFILSERERSRQWKILASAVGLPLAYGCYIWVLSTDWMTAGMAMDNLYWAFFILLIPFILFIPGLKVRPIDYGSPVPISRNAVILTALFLSLTLICIFPYYSIPGNANKVVIYERNSSMGFYIPKFPGLNQSFMPETDFSVGALRLYLKNLGYSVEELNDTDPHTLKEALNGAGVLMMINLNKEFSSSELNDIHEFIKSGGNLLVFADHTSMFVSDQDYASGKDYLDEVLEPTGIKINTDTADNIQGHWTYSDIPLPHYITRNMGFEITTSSVGASLDLQGNARPILIGRYSFSDKPNPNSSGHLGNRTYEKGEELGDLVVAASSTYGKGNVLVFGDTSYIFNSVLPFRYNMVCDSIAWLMSRELGYASDLVWLSFVILAALITYIVIMRRHIKVTISLIASFAVIIALSLVIAEGINGSLIEGSTGTNENVAFIDHSHLNQFNMENFQDDSIAGLVINLYRNGYLPMVIDDKNGFPGLQTGKLMFIIAPNAGYTQEEASAVRSFVDKGGLLVISAGHKSSDSLDSILSSFGLHIGDLPLGSPPWIVDTHGTGTMGQGTVTPENLEKYWHQPKFMDAYPVTAAGNYSIITWLNYSGREYNLIISKRVGQGEVILIGDSRYLLNENLEYLSEGSSAETKEPYQLQWLGNIELLREMLTKYREGKA